MSESPPVHHEGLSVPTPWGPLSSTGPMTILTVLLVLLALGLGTLIVIHDNNLDAHRAKAAEQIRSDARTEQELRQTLQQLQRDLGEARRFQQRMYDILVSLIPRYPHQPNALSPTE